MCIQMVVSPDGATTTDLQSCDAFRGFCMILGGHKPPELIRLGMHRDSPKSSEKKPSGFLPLELGYRVYATS